MDVDQVLVTDPGLVPYRVDELTAGEGHPGSSRQGGQNVELGARGEVDGQGMVAVKGLNEGASVIVGSIGALRAGSTIKMVQGGK